MSNTKSSAMKEYVAVWHIGEATRGEIIRLSDKEAERLLKLGAVIPARVPGGTEKNEEPEIVVYAGTAPETMAEDDEEVYAAEEGAETEEGAEIEEGDGAEAEAEEEAEADEDAVMPEIDALEAIGEAEPEPEKPARKSRKSRKGA